MAFCTKQYLAFSLLLLTFSTSAHAQIPLWLVEQGISLQFSIPQIDAGELKKALQSDRRSQYIFFDTRLQEEFQTSHLPEAIQIDPEMEPEVFFKIYGHLLSDKEVIFYCSVGYRSSKFAETVSPAAEKRGAKSVSNLKGGIFRWYNAGYAVVDKNGITDAIHPYNEEWGSLIELRHPNLK
ncbi:MAG: rhodanese-like domain-containing protein [SAR324 cluster bacterium]|nr:rhodanese-like domain-containing protein [SAR324 cluster bacterium]